MAPMRIRLTLSHQDSPGSPSTYVFEQDQVIIGRAAENDLALDDVTSVVSKRHAQLRVGAAGLTVEDLGSKNFTLVNGQRLAAHQPRALQPGDKLEIGPYTVSVDLEREAPRDLEQTVFAAGFANPFDDVAQHLAEAFGQLRRALVTSSYPRRDEALRDALRQAMGPGEDAEVLHAVLLGEAPPRTGQPPADPPSPPPSDALPRDAHLREAHSPWNGPRHDPGPSDRQPYGPPGHLEAPARQGGPGGQAPRPAGGFATEALPDELLERLLHVVTRLLGIPWQFRHEFIGHTILHTPETAFLYDGDAAALRSYLTEGPEREERLRLLEDAAEQVLLHQVAMLEGYRAAAEAGAGTLLDAVDPDKEADAAQENAVGKFLSAVKGGGAVDRFREKVRELRSESVSVLERRFFRPAFIDAYLTRLADRKPPSSNHP